MNKLISNVQKITDALYPSQTNTILFKDFQTAYSVESQSEGFIFNSYKREMIEGEEVLTFIKAHSRNIQKAELDTLAGSLNIDAVSYTDRRNEQIIKGAIAIIDSEGIFGLTAEELDIVTQ